MFLKGEPGFEKLHLNRQTDEKLLNEFHCSSITYSIFNLYVVSCPLNKTGFSSSPGTFIFLYPPTATSVVLCKSKNSVNNTRLKSISFLNIPLKTQPAEDLAKLSAR